MGSFHHPSRALKTQRYLMERSSDNASLSSTHNFVQVTSCNSSYLPHSGQKSWRRFSETKDGNNIYHEGRTLQLYAKHLYLLF